MQEYFWTKKHCINKNIIFVPIFIKVNLTLFDVNKPKFKDCQTNFLTLYICPTSLYS